MGIILEAVATAELGARWGLDPLGLGLCLLLLLLAFGLATLSLDVLVVDGHGLVDFGTKGVVIVNAIASQQHYHRCLE